MREKIDLEAKWESLTITDNFIFSATMHKFPDLCRRLLEEILQIKIIEIVDPDREKSIKSRRDSKGIRLDVYAEDHGKRRMFDLEMQTTENRDLPERTRYYQGLIDQNRLEEGKHYRELWDSYIIFICTFDFCGYGDYVYSFSDRCDEHPEYVLKTRARKFLINTKGTHGEVSPNLKEFIDYVERGMVSGKFSHEFDDAVQNVKLEKETRLEFMNYEMELIDQRDRGRAEGRAEGRLEGRLEGQTEEKEFTALKMLRKKMSIESIQEITELSIDRILELEKEIHDK